MKKDDDEITKKENELKEKVESKVKEIEATNSNSDNALVNQIFKNFDAFAHTKVSNQLSLSGECILTSLSYFKKIKESITEILDKKNAEK